MRKIIAFILVVIISAVLLGGEPFTVDLGQRVDVSFQHGDSLDIEPIAPDSVPRYFVFKQNGVDTIRTGTLALHNAIVGLYTGNFNMPTTTDSIGNYWLLLKFHQQGKIIQASYRDYDLRELIDGEDILDSLGKILDSTYAIIDSMQSQDDWVAKEASLFDGIVNLDNCTGTLATSQFETGFLTATLIADDAIDFATFAGTEPTSWWQPTHWVAGDSLAIYGLVWEADTAGYNGVAGSFGLVLATPSYVQGAGADATPSEWDATDSSVFKGLVWENADTASLNDVAGTYGEILAKAAYVQGAGGDPWATDIPGSYTGSQAGYIVGTYVDAAISAIFDPSVTADSTDIADVINDVLAALGYTAARAGYIDNVNLSFNNLSTSDIAGNALTGIRDSLGAVGYTAARAVYLDLLNTYLDAAISGLNDLDSATAYAAIKHYFWADSASADSGDGSIIHKIISDAAGGSAPTTQEIYDKFIEGSNEQQFWGAGSGAGTEQCTIYVYDQDTTIIPNCDVYGYTDGTGTQIAYGNTEAGGFVILNFNVGAADLRAGTLPGYAFESNYDITVTQDSTWGIYATKLAPSQPSPGFTTVSFYVNNPGYDTLDVEFFYQLVDSTGKKFDDDELLTFGSGINTMVLSRYSYTVLSDSSIFEKQLLPSPDIVVDGDSSKVFYKLKIKMPSGTVIEKDTCTISGSTFNPFQ